MREVMLESALPTGLALDASTHQRCPVCKGGRSGEYSLTTYPEEGGVVLRCWRASCGWYALVLSSDSTKFVRKVREGRPYTDPLEPLTTEQLDFLFVAYGLDPAIPKARRWASSADKTELVFPIKAISGDVRGHVTKSLPTPGASKAKRVYMYKTTAGPFLDWWIDGDSDTLVIVEDCISAARLNQIGYTSVALLGTNISAADAKELAIPRVRRVILALDRDAFGKALKFADRHKHILTMLPVCLEQDIKDTPTDAGIHRALGGKVE